MTLVLALGGNLTDTWMISSLELLRTVMLLSEEFCHAWHSKVILCNTYILQNLTVQELLDFGQQIAEAMDYLSNQSVVHGNLALRNCL